MSADHRSANGELTKPAGARRKAKPCRSDLSGGDDVPAMYTISQVAEKLQLSPRQVRRYIAGRVLPVHCFGRRKRISGADLAAFIARRREV